MKTPTLWKQDRRCSEVNTWSQVVRNFAWTNSQHTRKNLIKQGVAAYGQPIAS